MIKKITPLQYAIFLYEITLKKGKIEVQKLVKDFLGILAKNNDLAKAGEIIKEFEIYERKQKGVREVEIISARPLAQELKKQIVGKLKQGGDIEVRESVNPDLLLGVVLTINDTMIDGSLRNKLRELNKVLSYGR